MTDREKVNKGLELLYDRLLDAAKRDAIAMLDASMVANALSLLKEQEAKTGTWQWKIHGKAESGGTLGEAICDQCGKSTYATAVKGDLNYCPNCGANMMDRR